jgi:hypothetical protein
MEGIMGPQPLPFSLVGFLAPDESGLCFTTVEAVKLIDHGLTPPKL